MRNQTLISSLLKFVIFGVLSLAVIVILHEARVEYVKSKSLQNEWRREAVLPPAGAPSLTQESIDIALAIYGIEVPEGSKYPVYSSRLADRGLSMREPWDKKIKVEIGPSAFTSWALLGSTLAHELEIHCHQSFIIINFLDSLGLDGTGEAERQAYVHELKNARRFGLSAYDTQLITATMEYYYPAEVPKKSGKKTKFAGQVTQSIGKWLARRFVVPVY